MKTLRGQQALPTGNRDLGKDCTRTDWIKILTLKGCEESSVEDGLKGRAVKAWACLMPKSWGLWAKAWAWAEEDSSECYWGPAGPGEDKLDELQDARDLGWVEHGLLKYTEYNRRLRKQSLLPEWVLGFQICWP